MSTDTSVDISVMEYYSSRYDISLITAREEKELAYRIIAGDKQAEDRLFGANLRLVFKFAKKLSYGKKWLFGDLVQSGVAGLNKAVIGFDPERDSRFSTYATLVICNPMFSFIKDTSVIKFSDTKQKQINRLNRIFYNPRNTFTSMDTEKSMEWIASEFNRLYSKKDNVVYTKNHTLEIINDRKVLYFDSLDELKYEDGDETIVDYTKDENSENPESVVYKIWDSKNMSKIINVLKEVDRDVIIRLYGLNGVRPGTYESVGKALGKTREQLRMIEAKAFRRLRSEISEYHKEII